MEIEEFALKVKKDNKRDKILQVLSIIELISYLISILSFVTEAGYLAWDLGVVIIECIFVIIVIDMSRISWDRYLYFFAGKFSLERKSITEITRLHSFSENEYFKYINKKMRKLSVFTGTCSLVSGIIISIYLTDEISFDVKKFLICVPFIIISAICPFFVGKIKKSLWEYTSINKGKINTFLFIVSKLFAIVELAFFMGVTFFAAFEVWTWMSLLFWLNIDDTQIVLRTYPHMYSLPIYFIMLYIFFITFLRHNRAKKRLKILFQSPLILIIIFIVLSFIENNIYYEFTYSQIRVKTLFEENTYEIEDIESFIIYDDDGELQMKIYFEDNNYAYVSGMFQGETDEFDNKYYSYYGFIADYINILDEAGIDGKVENIEQLEDETYVFSDDEEDADKEALEKIIEYYYNNQ